MPSCTVSGLPFDCTKTNSLATHNSLPCFCKDFLPFRFNSPQWHGSGPVRRRAVTEANSLFPPISKRLRPSLKLRIEQKPSLGQSVFSWFELLSLLLWCNSILLWILTQKTAAPNLLSFVEVDIGSKSTFSAARRTVGHDETITDAAVEDWSTMLKRAALGMREPVRWFKT
jgi:hypothetical protein